jgi:serine/threonine protein kinase
MAEGTKQLGKYLLLEVLGEGASARVYRAIQAGPMGFRKQVAVKQILPHVIRNHQAVRGLINEARLGGHLHHRNLVEMYEFDQDGQDFYIAMELVPGITLAQLLRRTHAQGAIPQAAVAEIAVQLTEGLAYAHTATDELGQPLNLIHRDLKPGNVMITPGGVIKIMDFGVAKSAANLYHTQVDNVTRGTPSYMSPEQVRGAALDHRSDLFGLGALLVELITGAKLFQDPNRHHLLAQIQRADVTDALDDVGERMPAMVPVLARALERHRDQRYSTAAEMGRDIRRACAELLGTMNLGEWLVSWTGLEVSEDPRRDADDSTQFEVSLEPAEPRVPTEGEDALSIELDLEAEAKGGPLPVARVSTAVHVPGGALGDPLLEIVLIRMEPTTFWMGSRDDLTGSNPDEFLHRVRLSRPFLIAATPVTQAQWSALMGSNPSWNRGDDLPVESLRWLDAVAFCNRLSQSMGFRPAYRVEDTKVSWNRRADGFRLPTEAEWEMGARGDEDTTFSGSADPDDVAWYWDNAEGVSRPVGTRKRNGVGLYDMCGNVSEWVWDRYGPYPAESLVVDPVGPARGEFRVCRGGSSFSLPADLRVTARYGQSHPEEGYHFVGFRLARTILGQSVGDATVSPASAQEPSPHDDDTEETPIPSR